jgi:protein-L-isoaspartate(D-aspartate) O-methyltransferase
MPSCKVCGIDIPKPGLCAECKAEKAAAPKKVKGGLPSLILIVSFCTLILAGVVIFAFFPTLIPGLQKSPAVQAAYKVEEIKEIDTEAPAVEKNTEAPTAKVSPAEEKATAPKKEEAQDKAVPVAYDISKIKESPPIDNQEDYLNWMLKHTTESEAALSLRWSRAQEIIASGQGEFADKNALRAYLLTPREQFTRGQNLFLTYGDRPLQIGYGQTITAPNVMAMMTTSLKVEPQHKVLEIGTGSGYQAAVLSQLSNYVYTIEIIEGLHKETDKLFASLEKQYPIYKNIKRRLGDGYYGWPEDYASHEYFDRIIVTCSIDHLPPPLIKALKVGGIIIVPLGPPYRQFLMRIEKVRDEDGEIRLIQKDVYDGMGVIFVPFTNREGQSYSE